MSVWWSTRTRRERLMLGLLGAVVAGMVAWGVVQGLTGWREGAERRMNQAANDHALVLAGTAMMRDAGEQPLSGGLEARVQQAAEANGLEPIITADGQDGLAVNFESAPSASAFAWLAQLEAQGVRVKGFTALKNADGALQVSADLALAF